ncbi:DBH-like monooxygenase protein 1 [Halocaridina rubra]|uniref:DBH-like monooxygenase protein 1 n=1 Tax=Halocaridina rubra TaxID=373956 RepID=A0AAN8WW35_HALRR
MKQKRSPWAYLMMMMLLACGWGTITAAKLSADEASTVNLQHQAILDQLGNFVMLWSPLEREIHIEIQAATKGYIGLGFSPTGGMKGADIVLAWIDDQTGELHIHDRHARGMFIPDIDNLQNIDVIGGYQNDTHTVVRFSRPWNTCDNEQDYKLSGDTTRIIWAYSDEDPKGDMDMLMHSHRGTKSIYLREPTFELPQFSEEIKTVEFLASNVELPDDLDTMYWCQIYKFPDLKSKHHMLGYVPVIQEGHQEQVHHIILNECHLNDSSFHYEQWLEAGGRQCFLPNMPLSWNFCKHSIIAWAVGSDGAMYPEHVGMPLGEDYGGSDYYLMQTHYDNPHLKQGVIDNSGLRIFYTDKPREIDAGVLMIGHSVATNLIIPPNQRWKTTGICSGDCTGTTLPEDGIRVFQGLLHSHLLGRTIKMKQFRNGREMPTVFEDKNYDFNYQQERVLKENLIIMPGDTLTAECEYDSTKKKFPTFGGEDTQDEMCLIYLTYYPRMDLSICMSTPETSNIYHALGVNEIYETEKSDIYNWKLNELTADDIKKRDSKFLSNPNADFEEVNFSFALKKLKVKNPIEKQNRSVYDLLHDESTWQDPSTLQELQKQVTFGMHKALCFTVKGKQLAKGTKTKYPDHIKIDTLEDDECKALPIAEVYETEKDKKNMQPTALKGKDNHDHSHENTQAAGTGSCTTFPTLFLQVLAYSVYIAFLV